MSKPESIPPCSQPATAGRVKGTRRWLWVVFLAALATRTGWGVYREVQFTHRAVLEFPDEIQYWEMASAFREGKGLPDELGYQATRMPLYPLFLSRFAGTYGGVLGARIAQWIIGAVAAVFTSCAAWQLFGDRRAAWIAGLLVAFDPFLIFFSSLLLTETVFVTLLCCLWWQLSFAWRDETGGIGRWLAIGVVGALCVLVRESALGLLVLGLAGALSMKRFQPRSMLGGIAAVLIVAAALLPWAVRNHRVVGSWCWLTTRGGISLYDGVRPGAMGDSDLGDVKQMPAVRGFTETEWNAYFTRVAWRLIRDDPGRVATLAGRKILRMWNPVPNVESYRSGAIRMVSAAWMIPTMLLALVGAVWVFRDRGAAVSVLLLLPAAYLTLLHAVFVGSVRYRLAAMPMLELLAAFALTAIWYGHSAGRRQEAESS